MLDASNAPADTIHISYDNTEYWVAPWCAWRGYMPAGTSKCVDIPADALNRFLSMNEVEQYIIPTDISQWELISSCEQQYCIINGDTDLYRNSPDCACAMGTLQPGTYLFYEYYDNERDMITPKAQIAIFDHAVGYMSVHAAGVFENVIDTTHATFQSYTMRTPEYTVTHEAANISHLPTNIRSLYVYKLK